MKIIIIGAGLGGLECGYLLAKQGFEVTILEKNPQIGGCLQSFIRHGQRFDTGFHYVGGLCEGELLHTLFEQFNLTRLPWHQLDTDCFDEVIWEGEHYSLANGYDLFAETLAQSFPDQRDAIATYARFLKENQSSLHTLTPDNEQARLLMGQSAYQYVNETFRHPVLRNVIAATSLKMELRADTLPLYIYAQINGSFIQSAWRLRGGGQQIADSLARDIRNFGGEILTKKRVIGVDVADERIGRVRCPDGEDFPCDAVIADIHPAQLLSLLPDGAVRKRYCQRIIALPNSFGIFTVHLALKPGAVTYRNRNLFIHHDADLWEIEPDRPGVHSAGVHFAVPEDGGIHTDNIDIFVPMKWEEVSAWSQSHRGNRPEEYLMFKQKKAEEIIGFISPYIPDLKNNIKNIYTSSPLTYHDYTGTREGSAYGIRKDYDHLMTTMIPIHTPLSNLFFTGQNVNFHGVLGVSITSMLTVRQFLEKRQ